MQQGRELSFDGYQERAVATCSPRQTLATLGLGLCGEAGELANKLEKMMAQGHVLEGEALRDELGDCLWYLAVLAHCFGLSLSEVASRNVEKLAKRYPEGSFSEEASRNRPSE